MKELENEFRDKDMKYHVKQLQMIYEKKGSQGEQKTEKTVSKEILRKSNLIASIRIYKKIITPQYGSTFKSNLNFLQK